MIHLGKDEEQVKMGGAGADYMEGKTEGKQKTQAQTLRETNTRRYY